MIPEKHVPKTRLFNHKTYRYTMGNLSKRLVDSEVKDLRKSGFLARSIKLGDRYFIYTRTK